MYILPTTVSCNKVIEHATPFVRSCQAASFNNHSDAKRETQRNRKGDALEKTLAIARDKEKVTARRVSHPH